MHRFFFHLLCISALMAYQNPSSNLEFVGYYQGYPALSDYSNGIIYLYKRDSLCPYRSYEKGLSVQIIRDKYFLFIEGNKKNYRYILENDTHRDTFSINGLSIYASIDQNGCIYYTDIDEGRKIKSLNNSFDGNINGYVTWVDQEYIYYKVSNEESIHPDATDFRYHIKTKTIENLCTNTSEDDFLLLEGLDIIYTMKLDKGKFRPIFYDIEKKKLIEIDEAICAKIHNSSLVFYNPLNRTFYGILNGKIEALKRF
ncbi:MAG: hypothetical protein KIS77_05015 [Saprospiraceae bacterium]|nr:hypothetical protein [Saprospiraceae bacterium]